MIVKSRITILRLYHLSLCVAVTSLYLTSFTVSAAVDSIEVISSGDLGVYADRQYSWARVKLNGSFTREDGSVGKYRVPAVLMLPSAGEINFGFVDVANGSSFAVYTDETAPKGKREISYNGSKIFSDQLFNLGASYIGVVAYKMVTEALGEHYGVIERGTDGYQIIKDASDLLRHGDVKMNHPELVISPTETVIGFGLSATAGTLRYMVQEGMNRKHDGTLYFDGVIPAVNNGCFPKRDEPILPPAIFPQSPWYYKLEPCTDQIPGDGKIITVLSETDYVYFPPSRPQAANHRQYELAGVAHIPSDMRGLEVMGVANQNPVSYKPVFRAVLVNMLAWLDGVEPPPSKYLDVVENDKGELSIVRDQDGNATGGLRLPHMPRMTNADQPSGAPLGVYSGINEKYRKPRSVFPFLAGTFIPYSDEKLSELYPDRDTYIHRVKSVADQLLLERYILPSGHRNYLKAAQYQQLKFLNK